MSFTRADGFLDLDTKAYPLLNDRYKLIAVLGTGTFSQLVKARDVQRGVDVALKIMNAQHASIGIQEYRQILALNEADPGDECHIIRLLGTFYFKAHFCLVLELLDTSLLDHMRAYRDANFSMPLNAIRKVTYQLLCALAFLRTQDVLHTDLKPENVVLVRSPLATAPARGVSPTTAEALSRVANARGSVAVKLVDFGNALCPSRQPLDGAELQTLYYRAPEVVFRHAVGRPADVWSLGCIVFEMLLGRPLFHAERAEQLVPMWFELLGPMPESFARSTPQLAAGAASTMFSDAVNSTASADRVRRLSALVHSASGRLFSADNRVASPTTLSDLTDLLSCLLQVDQAKRITPLEAMMHPFFAALHPVAKLLKHDFRAPSMAAPLSEFRGRSPLQPAPINAHSHLGSSSYGHSLHARPLDSAQSSGSGESLYARSGLAPGTPSRSPYTAEPVYGYTMHFSSPRVQSSHHGTPSQHVHMVGDAASALSPSLSRLAAAQQRLASGIAQLPLLSTPAPAPRQQVQQQSEQHQVPARSPSATPAHSFAAVADSRSLVRAHIASPSESVGAASAAPLATPPRAYLTRPVSASSPAHSSSAVVVADAHTPSDLTAVPASLPHRTTHDHPLLPVCAPLPRADVVPTTSSGAKVAPSPLRAHSASSPPLPDVPHGPLAAEAASGGAEADATATVSLDNIRNENDSINDIGSSRSYVNTNNSNSTHSDSGSAKRASLPPSQARPRIVSSRAELVARGASSSGLSAAGEVPASAKRLRQKARCATPTTGAASFLLDFDCDTHGTPAATAEAPAERPVSATRSTAPAVTAAAAATAAPSPRARTRSLVAAAPSGRVVDLSGGDPQAVLPSPPPASAGSTPSSPAPAPRRRAAIDVIELSPSAPPAARKPSASASVISATASGVNTASKAASPSRAPAKRAAPEANRRSLSPADVRSPRQPRSCRKDVSYALCEPLVRRSRAPGRTRHHSESESGSESEHSLSHSDGEGERMTRTALPDSSSAMPVKGPKRAKTTAHPSSHTRPAAGPLTPSSSLFLL